MLLLCHSLSALVLVLCFAFFFLLFVLFLPIRSKYTHFIGSHNDRNASAIVVYDNTTFEQYQARLFIKKDLLNIMIACYHSIKTHFPNSFKTALRLLCDNISLSVIIYIRLYNIFVECWIFVVPPVVLVFLWVWYGTVRARPTSIVFERFYTISARKFHHMLVQFDSFWSNIYSLCSNRFPSFYVLLLICRNFKLKILNLLNILNILKKLNILKLLEELWLQHSPEKLYISRSLAVSTHTPKANTFYIRPCYSIMYA